MYSMPLYFEDRPVSDDEYASIARNWRATDALPWYQKYRETPIVIIEENEMPQWRDPEQLWNAVNAMGTNFVRYPAIGWASHFYGESKALPKYPGMKPEEDFFGEVSRYFHERGGYVCSYNHFGGVMYGTVLEQHPDWVARDNNGEPIPWNNMHWLGCLSSDGFVDAMLTAFDEYIDRYQTDAVYLDAPAWYVDWCHCDGCKKLWRETFGEEMPEDCPDCSPAREKLHHMRERRYFAIVRAVHAITQKYGIPLILNHRGHANLMNNHGNKELNLTVAEGANAGEGYRPNASFWSMASLWRLGEAEKVISYAYCPTGPYDNMRSYGTDETLAVGMGQVMFGMTPFLQSGTSYLFDTTGAAKLRAVCENINAHAPIYYRTAPVRDLGLVSDEFVLRRVSAEHKKQLEEEYQGCIEALSHGKRHFDCIFDAQLGIERLRGYRALYLPMTAYVSSEREKVLRQYVEEGGSVIVGPDFSRFDEHMNPLPNYTMADFLGTNFIRENDRSVINQHEREYRESASVFPYAAVPEAYVRLKIDLPGMPVSSPMVPIGDTVVRIERPINMYYTHSAPYSDTEILAEMFLPAGGLRGAPLVFPEGTPPAITRHAYGKGFVYQLHFRPGYIYQHRGLPDNRQLICAICDTPDAGPVVDFEAPGAVLCFYVENAEGTRYLHLSSYTGAIHERSMMLDRIAPLYNIPFRIREDRPIKSITTVYGKQGLEFVRKDGYVYFTLPKLEIYESLCVNVK